MKFQCSIRFPGMLPIGNISYLLPMCCSFWEKCINSQKTGQGCSTPLTWLQVSKCRNFWNTESDSLWINSLASNNNFTFKNMVWEAQSVSTKTYHCQDASPIWTKEIVFQWLPTNLILGICSINNVRYFLLLQGYLKPKDFPDDMDGDNDMEVDKYGVCRHWCLRGHSWMLFVHRP